ncbi:MAG: hypothetical protein LBI99_04155, partial [Propionibacteriaceae bacterium]|nr:hypothetical protein [Propionibacteriaceae bacterium]
FAPAQPAPQQTSGPTPAPPAWPPPTENASLASTPENTEPPKRRRGLKIFILALVGLVITVLVVVGIMWALSQNTMAGLPPGVSASEQLVTSQDLSDFGAAGWTQVPDGQEVALPLCMNAEPSNTAAANRTDRRGFTATEDATQTAVHSVYTYADEANAAEAFSGRRSQASSCSETTAQVIGYYEVSSVADQAEAVTIYYQAEPAATYHTVFFSRTGRVISILDISSPTGPVPPVSLATATTPALNQLCAQGEQGICPSTPGVVKIVPPTADNRGWLAKADLPRITNGAGVWDSTSPTTSLQSLGTQCEGDGFPVVSSAEETLRSTYILGDDPNSPPSRAMGIDEVVYTFSDLDKAEKLVDKLINNISSCQQPGSTATVEIGYPIQGAGLNSVPISGETYAVEQRKSENEVVRYRVAVVLTANRMAYLMANPTDSYDFSDAQWVAIALRAGERLSQF